MVQVLRMHHLLEKTKPQFLFKLIGLIHCYHVNCQTYVYLQEICRFFNFFRKTIDPNNPKGVIILNNGHVDSFLGSCVMWKLFRVYVYILTLLNCFRCSLMKGTYTLRIS